MNVLWQDDIKGLKLLMDCFLPALDALDLSGCSGLTRSHVGLVLKNINTIPALTHLKIGTHLLIKAIYVKKCMETISKDSNTHLS